MAWYAWRPYVPVSVRRRNAARAVARSKKTGEGVAPVVIQGRLIARSFWGKAWCDNLEAYSDFANRLPRGRTYVRNGSVMDLQLGPGTVRALVSGSELYRISIRIAPLARPRWQAVVRECAGKIGSLVELLQGKFSRAVMELLIQRELGLFPAAKEITFACSCPDWAAMCKHVAATLYGVGARLDAEPELFFRLRRVDQLDLLTAASSGAALATQGGGTRKRIAPAALADVFGIELDPRATAMEAAAGENRGHGRGGGSQPRGPDAPPCPSQRPRGRRPDGSHRPSQRPRGGQAAARPSQRPRRRPDGPRQPESAAASDSHRTSRTCPSQRPRGRRPNGAALPESAAPGGRAGASRLVRPAPPGCRAPGENARMGARIAWIRLGTLLTRAGGAA